MTPVSAPARRTRFWLAFAGVYAVVLVVIAGLVVADPDLSTRDTAIWLLIGAAAPALAFAAGAAPLWRRSANRAALLGGALVATAVALVVTVATWGLLLPLTAVLVGLAVADVNEALRVSGRRAYASRFVILATCLLIFALVVGFSSPLVAGAAAIAAAAWGMKRLLVDRRR